jgi:hypothetical protein
MKIHVDSVFHVNDHPWVEFTCELGRGEAMWRGVEPMFGRDYFVELDLGAPIEIVPTMIKLPLLDAAREEVKARGCVIAASAGVATLRLGDANLRLEARLAVGDWVAVRSGPLTLFENQNL